MKDPAGGRRVWVPTIAVGWVEPDLVPLPLPRALGTSRAGGGILGAQILDLKLVPNFKMIMMDVMVMKVLPKYPLLP